MTISKALRKPRLPLNYSLFHAVIDILYDLTELSPAWASPYASFKKFKKETMNPELKNWRLKRALRYLDERQRIKIRRQGGEIFFKLTKKGKLDALMIKMAREFKKRKKWDGKWRIIIWDIPESSRRYRNQLRYFCKSLGFFSLQKSAFITPYPLPASAVQYLEYSGLTKFIRFLRADQLDSDKTLLKHFGLYKTN